MVGWQVVEQTHALVLASGTLSPLPLLQRQLFPHHQLPSLHTFACGHVVPASRLLLLPFPCGPTGLSLDLRHATRSQPAMMDELGRLLMNVCQAVPEVCPCCCSCCCSWMFKPNKSHHVLFSLAQDFGLVKDPGVPGTRGLGSAPFLSHDGCIQNVLNKAKILRVPTMVVLSSHCA